MGFKSQKEYRPFPKKSIASSSGNKKKGVVPSIEVSNSNPFDVLNSVDNHVDLGTNGGTTNLVYNETTSSGSSFMNVDNSSTRTTPIIDKIGKFEELLTSGKATLVDEAGNPLKNVEFPDNYDSEDEVASVDNDMACSMASKRVGFGTQSLLEQWRDSYGNGDYDEDPHDDDMYEGQDLTQELQVICDNLDIRVRGHLGNLKYFLGIEVIKTKNDICLSQRKHYLELLNEYGLLGCKPISTPMEPNYELPYIPTDSDPLLDNITWYQKLLGKLIYLTHTRPDMSYSIHCLSQYMHSPLKSHLTCALNVLRYLKNGPSKEHRSMSSTACEIIWIQKLSIDLKVKVILHVDLFCDNKSALQLVVNPVFHEISKHFEIGVHFMRGKSCKRDLENKEDFSNQIADIFTEHLHVYQHKNL
ncbi:RNA-directed DNA polymerase, eukaryota, reverse transcriptase zinc-binding domain protein [Tanacetum coccineum]